MNPINLQISQLFRAAREQALLNFGSFEVQDQDLYSYVTLPAAINAPGGISFFGDTEATVGRQRTNMTRPNEVPGRTNYEIHGICVRFLPPLTVLYAAFLLAIRDAWIQISINNSERFVAHLSQFIPAAITAPSFSAAAGDNPVLTSQGYDYWLPLALPLPLQGGVNFNVRIFFITDSSTLGNTVMGVLFGGLIDRGNIKLDQSPVRPSGVDVSAAARAI